LKGKTGIVISYVFGLAITIAAEIVSIKLKMPYLGSIVLFPFSVLKYATPDITNMVVHATATGVIEISFPPYGALLIIGLFGILGLYLTIYFYSLLFRLFILRIKVRDVISRYRAANYYKHDWFILACFYGSLHIFCLSYIKRDGTMIYRIALLATAVLFLYVMLNYWFLKAWRKAEPLNWFAIVVAMITLFMWYVTSFAGVRSLTDGLLDFAKQFKPLTTIRILWVLMVDFFQNFLPPLVFASLLTMIYRKHYWVLSLLTIMPLHLWTEIIPGFTRIINGKHVTVQVMMLLFCLAGVFLSLILCRRVMIRILGGKSPQTKAARLDRRM